MTPSLAYAAGADDRRQNHHLGLVLLALGRVSDRDLSDYWEGWHKGRRERNPARDFVLVGQPYFPMEGV